MRNLALRFFPALFGYFYLWYKTLLQDMNIVRKIKMEDDMFYTTDKNSQIELGKI